MVMTRYIVAGFRAGTTRNAVQDYIAEVGLRVAQEPASGPDKDGYALELAAGPVTYPRIVRAANGLYEKGRQAGSRLFCKRRQLLSTGGA